MTVEATDLGTGTSSKLPRARALFRRPKAAHPGSATPKDPRVSALRRFAISITVLTALGETVLGFEEAYVTPVVAVLGACSVELVLETIEARARQRPVRYRGSPIQFADFLLPAYITGLACAMLLYANSELWPVVFAVTVAVGSKYVFRVKVNGRARHFLNPSNIGIVITLLLFPWVGIAPPYQFTEWVSGPFTWLIPVAILISGTMLNAKLTKKTPLIVGWVGGFALQAVIRTAVEHTATVSALLVMTGTVFVLFSNYMITDPGTTPVRPWRQVAFGAAAAVTYGLLVYLHIVFGLFFCLAIVCAIRGVSITVLSARPRRHAVLPVPHMESAAPEKLTAARTDCELARSEQPGPVRNV
jgi:Na+-translocating ferredoxin:NAD+ oxidoreductase RnfD subunit